MYSMRTHPYDLVIRGGMLFDPMDGSQRQTDIGVIGGKIAMIGDIAPEAGKTVIDAHGCTVTPGLIDYHCHVDYGGDWASLPAEVYALPSGITTVVDAGSAGCGGFELFWRNTITRSLVDIKAFLFVGSAGQVGLGGIEDENPDRINEDLILELCEKYPQDIVGIKLKIDREHVSAYGLEPLKAAITLGEKTGLRVSAHATDPAAPVAEILELLRPGDLFCHMYHDTGEGILEEDGTVKDCVRRARARGVLFDAAHGKTNNFSLSVAQKAIAQGLLPDVISSDYTKISLGARYPFTLMLTEYLHFGMSFEQIIERCTAVPARLLWGKETPFLQAGEPADLAVFAIEDKPTELWDYYGSRMTADRRIQAKLTVKDGMVLFDQMDDRYHYQYGSRK